MAYVDETYRDGQFGETPFYVLTAVVLAPEVRYATRAALMSIVPDGYWHTTDALMTESGRKTTRELVGFMAEYKDPCILSVRHELQDFTSLESMRASCLRTLMSALSQGRSTDPGWDPVRLVIMEARRHQKDQARDQHTARQARSEGILPRTFELFHTSPTLEQLLWLPDLVCAAYRRRLTHGEDYLDPLESQMVILESP
ncbi:MAG: hypothetical protein Q4G35_02360 [Propionibacteriaceae bacterium]|nr:hypothetical protein [Propionibacteriaceae bacterium]